MVAFPDCPEIFCALATGYPNAPKDPPLVYCDECGAVLTGEDKIFEYDGARLCDDCCKNRVIEEIDMEELAGALGLIVKTIETYMEDMNEY